MINNYETVVIMTPVLNDEDVKKTLSKYTDFLKKNKAEIIEEDHWGLKQLAYPIKNKTTGIYHVMEYKCEGSIIEELEVYYKRDENILRFLTVKLDKFAVKYNADKRAGLVGRNKKKKTEEKKEEATEA